MKNKNKYYLLIVMVIFLSVSCINKRETKKDNNLETKLNNELLPGWQEGYLDIHHINNGRGDACFMVFPDGTTLLFDAGNLDKEKFEKKYAPLKASSPKPNDSLTEAQNIALYIKQVMPKEQKPRMDYALISHFHEDHYGSFMAFGIMCV